MTREKKVLHFVPKRYWWEPSNSAAKKFRSSLAQHVVDFLRRMVDMADGRPPCAWINTSRLQSSRFLFLRNFSFECKQHNEIVFEVLSVYALCAQLNTIKVATEAAPNRFFFFILKTHCVGFSSIACSIHCKMFMSIFGMGFFYVKFIYVLDNGAVERWHTKYMDSWPSEN